MADKLSDEEIASELKRFGEVIKVPIDGKKRPILIKKLNHYRAKENPPLKRSRSGGRQSKRSVAPAPEFSDDSQDETESASIAKRIIPKRRLPVANEPDRRSLRNRNNDSLNLSQNAAKPGRGKSLENKRVTAAKQIEIYPNEFSDTDDTADESVYEVENKSINTSFQFDSVENEDEEDISPTPKWSRTGQYSSRRINTRLNSEKSVLSNFSNHSPLSSVGKGVKISSDETTESRENTVASTILTIVAVFFIVLAVSYAYIRRDIFLPNTLSSFQPELKDSKVQFCEDESCTDYEESAVKTSLQVINNLHDQLASLKGKFELGEITEENVRLQRTTVESYIAKTTKFQNGDTSRLVDLTCHLILRHPEWDIKVFDTDGTQAEKLSEVQQFEAVYGDLSLPKRLLLALYKVLYGVVLFCLLVLMCVLGIFCLRWQNKRKEKEQKKVYELVEKIIDILKDNCELAERKDDPKNYPPYMAVQHIRDQLIPVSKRKQLQPLWDEAVRFIEANESRIRVETQIIQGEEFTVWRWLQTFPNGGRMWQGQAFETSPNCVNALPYGPTPCLKVRNMFNSSMEQNLEDWHVDIEDAILEKCKNNGGILHIFVDRSSKEVTRTTIRTRMSSKLGKSRPQTAELAAFERLKKSPYTDNRDTVVNTLELLFLAHLSRKAHKGCVYIKCSSCEKAFDAYTSLHGWWFDGRLVTVKYLRLEHYHDRFPDSRNKKYPLRPSNNDMQSVSRPYHRSALEMT